jgi:acyl carrier protein
MKPNRTSIKDCLKLVPCLVLLAQFSCAKKTQAPPPAATPAITQNQTVETIRKIVANKLEVEPQTIDIEAPLSKQKSPADELDAVEIILDIEDTFKIEVKEDEVGGSAPGLPDRLSVRKLSEIVNKKLPAK